MEQLCTHIKVWPSQALSVMMMALGLLLKTQQTAEKEGEESGPVRMSATHSYTEVTGHLRNLRSPDRSAECRFLKEPD